MRIHYEKGVLIALTFPPNEWKVAVAVLKAIYKVQPFDWIRQAFTEIEGDNTPKQIPFTLSTRICEKCFCEIDIKTDNAVHYTGDQDKWVHRTCPTLKDGRPI